MSCHIYSFLMNWAGWVRLSHPTCANWLHLSKIWVDPMSSILFYWEEIIKFPNTISLVNSSSSVKPQVYFRKTTVRFVLISMKKAFFFFVLEKPSTLGENILFWALQNEGIVGNNPWGSLAHLSLSPRKVPWT